MSAQNSATPLGPIFLSTPLLSLTDRGLIALARLTTFSFLLIPFGFVALKILDYHLKAPVPEDIWKTIVDGAYAKLDDVSFWTAVVHLLCIGLVGTALLNLYRIDGRVANSFTFRSRHFFAWSSMVIVGWTVYFYSIYNTTVKGTFFSSVAPETRLAQILEGLLNLAFLAYTYGFAIVAWIAAGHARQHLKQLPSSTVNLPSKTEQILQAATNIANLPLVFVPALAVMFMFPLVWTEACKSLYPMTRSYIFNFAPGGFDPLSGHADGWPGIAKRFALLYSPFVIVGCRVLFMKPAWAGQELILSRAALGQNLVQAFLVDYHRDSGGVVKQSYFRCLNIALIRWFKPQLSPAGPPNTGLATDPASLPTPPPAPPSRTFAGPESTDLP